MKLMNESLVDEDGKKTAVASDSEFDAMETLENPIIFTDEDGNEIPVSSFDEALKLVVEGKVPSFVDDDVVSNIAEFGNIDGTEKIIVDEVITEIVSTKGTKGETTTSTTSTKGTVISGTKGTKGAKPELADCEDDC